MDLPVDLFLYMLFIGAVVLLVLTPGPVVSLVIAETLTESPRHGMAAVLGAGVMSAIMLLIYILGFGAIISYLTDDVLRAIRYAGAAYLIYLAVRSFRRGNGDAPGLPAPIARTPYMAFRTALLVAATNPKAILFFAAFFPQFISPDLPAIPQLVVLALTFVVLAPLLDGCWVLAAARARTLLQKRGSAQLINRISGSILAFAAVALLFLNQ